MPAPVPTTELWSAQLFGSGVAYGNGRLWVGGLGDGGVIDPLPHDERPGGGIGRKLGWWRAVPGTLQITLRRLDGPAPPGTATVPSGYGDRGFQSSGVTFSTPGCWEVTGRLDTDPEGSALTFTTFVLSR